MDEFKINIAADFSTKPGARFRHLGEDSGEAFYEEHLLPKYEEAIAAGQKLHIYLDGTRSYPYSFLDESLGKLARVFGLETVVDNIIFHATEKAWVIGYIHKEVWKDEAK